MLLNVAIDSLSDVKESFNLRYEDIVRLLLSFDGSIVAPRGWSASYDHERHVYRLTPKEAGTIFLAWDETHGWACAVAYPDVKTWMRVFDASDPRNRIDQFPTAVAVVLRNLGQKKQQDDWINAILRGQP